MKHLTTLITTLLLSLITTQMSADTGGTYQLVPKDYTFQEGDIIIIASYDSNNDIQIMTFDNTRNLNDQFFYYQNQTPEKVTDIEENEVRIITMPSSITLSEVNTNTTPIELYVSNHTAGSIVLKKHYAEGQNLKRQSDRDSYLTWTDETSMWLTTNTIALGATVNGIVLSQKIGTQ